MKWRLAIPVTAIAGAIFVWSQQERDLVIRSESRLVLLDVSVKDREGKLVAGLAKDNFKVLENGVPQEITVFSSYDMPVTVGILVDESFSMTPKRADALKAAETFIKDSNSQDEVFVLNFSDRVKRGLPQDVMFSSDIDQLRSALHRASPEGKTALYDALSEGFKHLEKGKRERKALLLISDGGDTASKLSRKEVIEKLEENTATIYSIGIYSPEDPDRDPGVLRLLSKLSGGEAYFPESPSGLPAICRAIAADIRTRYTIGYVPKTPKATGSFQKLRVYATSNEGKRLMSKTRTGYRY